MSSALNYIIAQGFNGATKVLDRYYGTKDKIEQDNQQQQQADQQKQMNDQLMQKRSQEMAAQAEAQQGQAQDEAEAQTIIRDAQRLQELSLARPDDPIVQSQMSELVGRARAYDARRSKTSLTDVLIPKQTGAVTLSGKDVNAKFGLSVPEDAAYQMDPSTGKLVRLAAGTTPLAKSNAEAAAAARMSADTARQQQMDMQKFQILGGLGDDLRAESKNFESVKDAYGRVLASSQTPSAAGDVALIFSYMKMLDPGSVIRESEYATAANAGSVPDRVIAAYNKALKGEALAPNQRGDFVGRAKLLFAQQRADQQKRNDRYVAKAKQGGLDPTNLPVPLDPADAGGQTGSQPPVVGTVEDGYRFKGGDPANQANWEQVK